MAHYCTDVQNMETVNKNAPEFKSQLNKYNINRDML